MPVGDELPQGIRNTSQVKRKAAKSINNDRHKSSSSASGYTNFKQPRVDSTRYRSFANYGRNNLNFKRLYEYSKPP